MLEKYIIAFEKNICSEHVLLFLIVIVMTNSVHSDEKKDGIVLPLHQILPGNSSVIQKQCFFFPCRIQILGIFIFSHTVC